MTKGELSKKKVVLMTIVVVAISALLVGAGTLAYFSASQLSGVNNFATGSISFSVNGADPWTGNFNASLADVKPGMTGWGNLTILNTGENPADLWLQVANVSTFSFGTNSAKASEPAATDIDGVLRYGMNRSTTVTPLASAYVDSSAYTISTGTHQLTGLTTGVKNTWIYLGVIQPNTPLYVNESFTLDKDTTNWAQLTNMTFTVGMYAQQSQGTPRPSAPTPELGGHTR